MHGKCSRCGGSGTVNVPVDGDIRQTKPVTCPDCSGSGKDS